MTVSVTGGTGFAFGGILWIGVFPGSDEGMRLNIWNGKIFNYFYDLFRRIPVAVSVNDSYRAAGPVFFPWERPDKKSGVRF